MLARAESIATDPTLLLDHVELGDAVLVHGQGQQDPVLLRQHRHFLLPLRGSPWLSGSRRKLVRYGSDLIPLPLVLWKPCRLKFGQFCAGNKHALALIRNIPSSI